MPDTRLIEYRRPVAKLGENIFQLVADKDPEQLRQTLERDFVGQSQFRKLLELRNERNIGPIASAIVKNRYESFVTLCKHVGNTNIEPRFDAKPRPKSEEKENLFLTAIRYYNHGGKDVAEYILQNVSSDSAFMRYEPRRLCALHEAADKGYIDIFETLAKVVPTQARRFFTLEDNLGRTPLHLASQRGFSDIVRVLIQMEPGLELKKDNRFENALWKAVSMGRKEVIITLLEHRPDLIKTRNTPVGAAAKTKSKGRTAGDKHASKAELVGKSVYQLACETAKTRPVLNVVDYGGGGGGGLQRSSTYDSSIKMLLKEYILGLQATSQEKRELLPKEERGKEIYLDLSLFNGFFPLEDRFSIYLESLEDLEIAFLDCLEFVRLPNLSCEQGGSCNVAGPRGHRVNSEAKKVFAFLIRNNVDRVLKVTVPDCPIHSHSTRDIADCLDGLDVRVLDWRKTDLDLNMVLRVAPYLEEITLYSSGNHDVLKHWCSFEGLVQFQELKKVNIFIYPGEHSEVDLQKLQQVVKTRLERHRRHKDHPMLLRPEVSDDVFGLDFVSSCECETAQFETITVRSLNSSTEASSSRHDMPNMGGTRHQESFFDKVRPIKEFLKEFHTSGRPDCIYARNNPVKVAIIDSGIAPNLDLDLYHVKGGKSFVEDTGSGTPDSHWHLVSNYHGSQLAQIVAATNPFCDIYAAKVYHGNARGGVDEDAALAAIKWARQQGVDIIVMSWTVSEASAKEVGKLHNRFRRTLHSASGKCLLFASTRDGASSNVSPFPASHSNVFAISSCPMDGPVNHDIAKTDSTRYYYLPGENFHLHVPKYLVAEGIKIDSGSSLATAAAAATASLILTCARFAFHEEDQSDSDIESRGDRSRSRERIPQLDGASPHGIDLSALQEDIARIEDDAMRLEEDLSRRFDSASESESSEDNDDQDSQDLSQVDDDSRSESVASSHDRMKPRWLDPELEDVNNGPAEKAFESLRTEEAMRAAFQNFSDTQRRVKIWDYIGPEYATVGMSKAKENLREMLKVFVG